MKPFWKHFIGFNLSVCMLAFLTITTPLVSSAQDTPTDVSSPTSSVSTNPTTIENELHIEVEETVLTPETEETQPTEIIQTETPETITNTIENSEEEVTPSVTPDEEEATEVIQQPAEEPEATQQPMESEKPVETAKPQESVKPQMTNKPVTTAKPQATAKPRTTSKPVTTAKPQATKKPTTIVKPQATAKPEASYDKVNKVTIANDKVAAEVNLDKKVPENLKDAYNAVKKVLSKATSGKQTIEFSKPITLTELKDVLYYVNNYNPQFFYVDFNQYHYYVANSKIESVTITCYGSETEWEEFEATAAKVVAEANKKANLFEREVYVHDWLVKNVKYDNSTEYSSTAYGALVAGRAGCEGYARAFQYLMNQIGVETVLITGRTDEGHMWNMVKLYGEYYFVDVTHDDPVPNINIKDGQEYKINRSCLNVSTKILKQTHTIDEKNSRGNDGTLRNVDLQNCTSNKHQYYNVKGLSVSSMSELKYVLNENKDLPNIEVFFEGTMPDLDEAIEAFEEFMEEQYEDQGYYYSTTSETSSVYQRNVIRFTWMTK